MEENGHPCEHKDSCPIYAGKFPLMTVVFADFRKVCDGSSERAKLDGSCPFVEVYNGMSKVIPKYALHPDSTLEIFRREIGEMIGA